MTILMIAAAAIGAVAAFRKTPEGQEATEGQTALTGVRRSTSVVLAIAEAVWAVLDALSMLTRPRAAATSTTAIPVRTPRGFGTQVSSDIRGE